MDILYKAVLVVHIASAALLFGGGVGLVKNLKRQLELGGEAFKAAALDAAHRGKVMTLASFSTLATGLALIFVLGGFKAVPLNIHIALLLMLIALGVSASISKPHGGRLLQLAKAESLDRDAANASIKKLAMGSGIMHLIWSINLVLMLVHR